MTHTNPTHIGKFQYFFYFNPSLNKQGQSSAKLMVYLSKDEVKVFCELKNELRFTPRASVIMKPCFRLS